MKRLSKLEHGKLPNKSNRRARCSAGGSLLRSLLLGLPFLLATSTLQAADWQVSSQDQFTTALAEARAGDRILVSAGTYTGDIVLDRPLALKGIGDPVLRGTGKRTVVTVLADGCTIEGFVIEHCGNELQQDHSGILLKSNNNRVEENVLRDILFGIYLFHSNKNTIRNNLISGRKELEEGGRGSGIHLYASPDNLIEGNAISAARDGFYIQNSDGNSIRNNRITDLRYGIHYMFSDSNTFENNYFSNNVAGAAIMYSKNIEFRRNVFVHNRGYSSFGILFQECEECLAEENFIVDNVTGIFAEALRESTFRRNVIAENDVALQMFSSADRNVFTENGFLNNLSPLRLIGKGTTTQWSWQGRGNFWSEYDGYDMDSDGIGDVPQKIQNVFDFMEGNYPRLRLYLYSPAAQALATAEKAFPILEGSPEVDPAPLMKAVSLQFPYPELRKSPRGNLSLSVASLVMGTAAILVMWKGQKPRTRASES